MAFLAQIAVSGNKQTHLNQPLSTKGFSRGLFFILLVIKIEFSRYIFEFKKHINMINSLFLRFSKGPKQPRFGEPVQKFIKGVFLGDALAMFYGDEIIGIAKLHEETDKALDFDVVVVKGNEIPSEKIERSIKDMIGKSNKFSMTPSTKRRKYYVSYEEGTELNITAQIVFKRKEPTPTKEDIIKRANQKNPKQSYYYEVIIDLDEKFDTDIAPLIKGLNIEQAADKVIEYMNEREKYYLSPQHYADLNTMLKNVKFD